jgi:hypothetical protein
MLNILANEATGLRSILLGWGADCEFPEELELERGAERRGLGDNLDFVRALGNIRGLEELVIQGYYAKHWPAYLEKTMGLQVRAKRALLTVVKEEELERYDWVEKSNEEQLRQFVEYQRGTGDLMP